MELSIIILNYNVRHFLELCLKSVEAAIVGLEAEIIVVDNSSPDASCEMVKQLFPKVKLIENRANYGFSKGNNIGVAAAVGNYVCILNPDTVVAEDTFTTLLKFAEKTLNLGVLGCKLIDGTGKFLPESKRNVPTPSVSLKKVLGDIKPYYASHVSEDGIGKVSICVGAFMLLKRSIYNELKGFDEDFFMYGEDMDFSYRALKAGYDNYYNASTTVIHFKGESTLKDKTYVQRFNGAMRIFFTKHFKTNIIFDSFLYLGIRALTLFGTREKIKLKNIEKRIVLTEDIRTSGTLNFPFEIEYATHLSSLAPQTEVIFDGNSLSFKKIIQTMQMHRNKGFSFKILAPSSHFIIGSDSSIGRGEFVEL